MRKKRFECLLNTERRHAGVPAAKRSRGGFTLVEMIVAGILLSVVMTVSMQMLAGYSKQQRLANRRQLAVAELANLIERITARPFSTVTTDNLQSLTINDAARARLPDAELRIEVNDQAGPPKGKQIRADIRWRQVGGEFTAPVRLATWIYAHTEETP